MVKHIFVERLRPGMVEKFERVGVELATYVHERGWPIYRAWRPLPGEEGEPPLFELGFLGRTSSVELPVVVFEAEYASRAELERQLALMREDREVLRLTMAIADCVEAGAGRSYIVERWAPPPPPRKS